MEGANKKDPKKKNSDLKDRKKDKSVLSKALRENLMRRKEAKKSKT